MSKWQRGATFSYLNRTYVAVLCSNFHPRQSCQYALQCTQLWQLHPWCHRLAAGCPDCTTVGARGSEIALNKSHCVHHWLHHSPCATDPKNRALKQFERSRWYTFPVSLASPSLPSTFFFSPPSLPQGLVGEKYGSIRVPGEVESAEFEMILDAAVEAGLDTHILEEWYCRDENSVPPAYYLKPKAQMLKNYQNSVSPTNLLCTVENLHGRHDFTSLEALTVLIMGSCPWAVWFMNLPLLEERFICTYRKENQLCFSSFWAKLRLRQHLNPLEVLCFNVC